MTYLASNKEHVETFGMLIVNTIKYLDSMLGMKSYGRMSSSVKGIARTSVFRLTWPGRKWRCCPGSPATDGRDT